MMKKCCLPLFLFAFLYAAPAFAAPCICPAVYKPVCGVNGKTYSNSCRAACAKTKVKCVGKCPCKVRPTCATIRCMKPRICKMIFGKPRCVCPPPLKRICKPGYIIAWKTVNGCKVSYCKKKPCICPAIYKPVCARKGSIVKTYGNACSAKCANAKVLYNGKCCKDLKCKYPKMCMVIKKRSQCVCKKFPMPRCAPGYIIAWKTVNGCKIPYCKKRPCICPKIYKPVCARKGRLIKTYSNACLAKCDNAKILYNGKCCKDLKCKYPKMCMVIKKRSQCICKKFPMPRCRPGYMIAWKTVNGCKVPYCKKKPNPCALIRCPKYTICRVVNGRAACYCGKKVCARGLVCKKVVCIKAPCYPVCMKP